MFGPLIAVGLFACSGEGASMALESGTDMGGESEARILAESDGLDDPPDERSNL